MKKLITFLLTLSSLGAMAQTHQKIGVPSNVIEVQGQLQVNKEIKYLLYKNNIAEDSIYAPDVNGYLKLIVKPPTGITQAAADLRYMAIVVPQTAFNRPYGTTTNTVTQGDDARILNGVTAFTWGNHALTGYYKASNFVSGVNYITPSGNTSGTAGNITGIATLSHGGTGATTAIGALNSLLPLQTGNDAKYLQTNAGVASWQAIAGTGGGTVVGVSVASANGFNGTATGGVSPVITIGSYLTGLLKGGGGSAITAAVAGVDYVAPNGNAGTVTNGLYTTGLYSNPTWLTALAFAKLTGVPAFLTGNQTITLHSTGGDVAIGSTSGTTDLNGVLTIANNAVTLAKIQTFAQGTIPYRASIGTGVLEARTYAQLKTDIGLDLVTNTSDANKPVSTAQNAINITKMPINNATATGTFTLPTTTNATIQTDRVPLFTFGAGSAVAGDTLSFTTNTVYGNVLISGIDTYVITAMNIVLQGPAPAVTVDVRYGATLNSGGTPLVTIGTPVTNTTTGTTVTVFNNTTIPPGNFIWCKTPSVTLGSKPTYMQVTLIGYKVRN